jgi:hypothetical protein
VIHFFAGKGSILSKLSIHRIREAAPLNQPKQICGFSDASELDAERLQLDEHVLQRQNLVSDQAVQKDTHLLGNDQKTVRSKKKKIGSYEKERKNAYQADEPVLHKLVTGVSTRLKAIRNVEVNHFNRKVHRCRQLVDDLHGMD